MPNSDCIDRDERQGVGVGDAGMYAELAALDARISADDKDAEAYYLRGRLKWKFGLHSEAMTDYEHSLAVDPKSPASEALAMAKAVMDFYHRDLYNP